jgi:hypothetical protein
VNEDDDDELDSVDGAEECGDLGAINEIYAINKGGVIAARRVGMTSDGGSWNAPSLTHL